MVEREVISIVQHAPGFCIDASDCSTAGETFRETERRVSFP
jgi:hypothetical protein